MAVYVDDMYTISLGNFGRMKMSHLMADSTEELLQMVNKIGVQRKWIQKAGTKWEHFDIAISKRDLAIKAGTIPIGMRILAVAAKERQSNNSRLEIKLNSTPNVQVSDTTGDDQGTESLKTNNKSSSGEQKH